MKKNKQLIRDIKIVSRNTRDLADDGIISPDSWEAIDDILDNAINDLKRKRNCNE